MLTEDNANIDPSKPQPYISEILNYKTGGKLLDVGAGWGRNSLFLAQKGFSVTAIEPDHKELSRLKESSTNLGLPITLLPTDLSSIDFKDDFDVVVCAMVLHFLKSQKEVEQAITQLKMATITSGIHLISVLHENTYAVRTYFFKPGELKSYYSDWEILDYFEGLGPRIPSEGGRQFTKSIIIARKP